MFSLLAYYFIAFTCPPPPPLRYHEALVKLDMALAQNKKVVTELEAHLNLVQDQAHQATQRATYGVQRCNKLRADARALTERLKVIRDKNKALLTRCNALVTSRNKWKAKVLPYRKKEIQRNLAKISRPTTKRGWTFKASIRYMYYRLFNCRVSERQANRVVLIVAQTFGLNLNARTLPTRPTLRRFRQEAATWSIRCAARAAAASKAKDPENFSIATGRDGTSKIAFNFQVFFPFHGSPCARHCFVFLLAFGACNRPFEPR